MHECDLNAGNLVPSVQIDALLAQREQILIHVRQALDLLVTADRLAVDAGFGSHWQGLAEQIERTRYSRFGAADRDSTDYAANPAPEVGELYAKDLDAGGWDYLLRASGLRTFMDSTAREQWGKTIQEKKAPPFTRDNITATFQSLHAARADMVERGVIEVFRGLSWHYKTNQPVRFGKRLIVSYLRGYRCRSTDQLDDLMRALCLYDGQPEPDHRNGIGAQVRAAESEGKSAFETAYFSLRWYKNGNGHVTFKCPALIDRLNAIIAKHYPGALPPARPS
jgi:hypothetical protein